MITFELNKDKTVYDGQEFKNLCMAARYVKSSLGKEDAPFQAVRGKMVCLTGDSFYKVAARDIEDESTGLRRGERYVKFYGNRGDLGGNTGGLPCLS